MDGGGPDIQIACTDIAGVRVGESTLLVGYVERPGRPRRQHHGRNDADGDPRDRLGLSHGPTGAALGYSAAMALIIIPIIAWSKQGTGITWTDLWKGARMAFGGRDGGRSRIDSEVDVGRARCHQSLFWRLGVELVFGVYAGALVAMGQRKLYLDLLSDVFRGRRAKQ